MENNEYISKILNDISSNLKICINNNDIFFFTDGASTSLVFSIKQKYLVKTMDYKTLKSQVEFLKLYNDTNYFQKIIYYNEKLNYICFEYIDGNKISKSDTINIKELITKIKDIVLSYKKYNYNGFGYLYENNKSWFDFLKDEVEYSKKELENLNISMDIVKKSLNILKDYKFEKKLIHGDFGFHNFLIDSNNDLKVIDPMPVVGDYLYDFYFAILSNANILKRVNISDILLIFDNENFKNKKALFIIVLYIRMSRCHKYNITDFKTYINIYKKMSF